MSKSFDNAIAFRDTTDSSGQSAAWPNMATEAPQNQTIYINNLNEKIKIQELKKSLMAIFGQFGPIVEIQAKKSLKMRGQAFVVFKSLDAASNAIGSMQGFPFYDKPMRIQYAKSDTDCVAKTKGTYVARELEPLTKGRAETRKERKRRLEADAKTAKKQAQAQQAIIMQAAGAPMAMAGGMPPLPAPPVANDRAPPPAEAKPPTVMSAAARAALANVPPNKILFCQNLPDETTEQMLHVLFNQFSGLKEVRLVPGRTDIAFIEYENEMQAGVAKDSLQNFKITPNQAMVVSFAKK